MPWKEPQLRARAGILLSNRQGEDRGSTSLSASSVSCVKQEERREPRRRAEGSRGRALARQGGRWRILDPQ